MASLAKFLEGGAFGVLNDILSTFHSEDAYAVPNRFECLILPPVDVGPYANNYHSDPWLTGKDARAVSLRCESTTMPGRTLNGAEDTNVYGPVREIINGSSGVGLIINPNSSQNYIDNYYYPVLPKVNKFGKFDEENLGLQGEVQNNNIPFGDQSDWNGVSNSYITNTKIPFFR